MGLPKLMRAVRMSFSSLVLEEWGGDAAPNKLTGTDGLFVPKGLMIVAGQFIAWIAGKRRPSRRDLSDFVPEGLNDRSQAIYGLECVRKDPSRRDGLTRATR